MYGRQYGDKTLNFEASGGLLDASLVMRDQETDSWWSIMSGTAIGGKEEGTRLEELPLGEKTTWAQWVHKHPDTLVLSIDGKEDDHSDPYANYFSSDGTFRGATVEDDRLPPKESVYSFQKDGKAYAISNSKAEGGVIVHLDGYDGDFFFYRKPHLSLFGSTFAVELPKGLLSRDASGWSFRDGGQIYRIDNEASDEDRGEVLQHLQAMERVKRLGGFDTFWYTWIAVHPKTVILP